MDVEKLVARLTEALEGFRCTVSSTLTLRKFRDRPTRPGDLKLSEWLEEVDYYCAHFQIPDSLKASVIISHLEGPAREEVRCHKGVNKDHEKVIEILERYFGTTETLQSLQQSFYNRIQMEHESLAEFSRELLHLYGRLVEKADNREAEALKVLRNQALMSQFVAGARNTSIRLELKRIQLNLPEQTFEEMRETALQLMSEFETEHNLNLTACHEVHAGRLVGSQSVNDSEIGTLVTEVVPILKDIQQSLDTIRLQTASNRVKRWGKATWKSGPCRYCGQKGHIRKYCQIRLPDNN